MERIVNANHN